MVLADHRRDVGAKVDVGEDLSARRGVLPDEQELGLGQLAGLAQDLGRHHDLAEVMQERRRAEAAHSPRVPAELSRDGTGELGHSALVTRRVGVAQLSGRAQGGDRRFDCALEPCRGLSELALGLLTGRHVAYHAQDQPLVPHRGDAPRAHLDRKHRAVLATVLTLEEDAVRGGRVELSGEQRTCPSARRSAIVSSRLVAAVAVGRLGGPVGFNDPAVPGRTNQ